MKPAEIINKLTKEGHLRFRYWSQSNIEYYRDVGSGICEGMSLDWLRRKFHDKRNFVDDEKYDPKEKDWGFFDNSNLPKLEKKQKLIHERYAHFRQQNDPLMRTPMFGKIKPAFDPVQVFAREYNLNRQRRDKGLSGFENMKYIAADSLNFSQAEEARQQTKMQIKQFMADVLDAVDSYRDITGKPAGVMISYMGEKNHATMYYLNFGESAPHEYFDPNVGEFHFGSSDVFSAFVADWWEAAYAVNFRIDAEPILYLPKE